jgi:hypothetical protein
VRRLRKEVLSGRCARPRTSSLFPLPNAGGGLLLPWFATVLIALLLLTLGQHRKSYCPRQPERPRADDTPDTSATPEQLPAAYAPSADELLYLPPATTSFDGEGRYEASGPFDVASAAALHYDPDLDGQGPDQH